MTIKKLLDKVRTYNLDTTMIEQAYNLASYLHKDQYRQSGESYIIHPLNVAYILANMYADSDTICAGLLHDTIEDTNIEKKDLEELFNPEIASLVDGVTKISKMDFSTKQDQILANTRKIITGITEDVRIIIIKLADRLHNMRTLEYKSPYKQIENSIETMEIFVPLAYYIGAYRIKSELEDLSLRYIKPNKYKEIENIKKNISEDSSQCLNEMKSIIRDKLEQNLNLTPEIKIRTKNIYGIYKRMQDGKKLTDIHDLLALKIMVNTVPECYLSLGLIHELYPPINEKFKDYIANPKTNMYRSLHTTVFGEKSKLVQTQIRTFDMDKIASFGLSAYWNLNEENSRFIMQDELKNKYQFFNSLVEIDNMFSDNEEFVKQVKNEIFSKKVYVNTTKGDVIELPVGSTVIDFAYKIHTDLGNSMIGAIVNDIDVPLNYVLQNKDRVRIIVDELESNPNLEWLNIAKTSYAKRRIKDYLKR